ncbi:MAG: hypothetical protein QXD54_05405 [Candidatus Aenigmatarchaeota archaeon]
MIDSGVELSPLQPSLPESLKTTLALAFEISQRDFSGINGLRKSGEQNQDEINFLYEILEAGQPPQGLLDYLDKHLPNFLPPEIVQALIGQGVLTQEGNKILWAKGVPPEKKLYVLNELVSDIERKQQLPNTGLIDPNHFLTGIQALALEYAKQAYDAYQPQSTPDREEIVTITQRKITSQDRFRMRVAYEGKGKAGVELDVEKEMIFSVKKDGKAVSNDGQERTYDDIIIPVVELIKAGNFEQAINLANQIREQFSQLLEKNPQEKRRILFILRRLINMRLGDTSITEQEKMTLQALLQSNLEDTQNFQEVLKLLFNFDSLKQEIESSDFKTKRRAEDRLSVRFLEMGALIFGTEGLRRTVEVDLRMAVGLEDILLTPEARLERIKLLQEADELRKRIIEIRLSKEGSEEERKLRALLAESAWREKLTQLRNLEQQQREAFLYAFQVKDDDGRLLIDESKLTPEQRQLADQIKQRYYTLIQSGNDRILSINRSMIIEMLRIEGITLNDDQITTLYEYLSGKKPSSAEKPLTKEDHDLFFKEFLGNFGINPDDKKYSLLRHIISEGRRVERALTGLARKIQDDFSQVEELSLIGTVAGKKPKIGEIQHNVFLMGVKGIEYLYRHFQFETEKREEKVIISGKTGEKPSLEFPTTVPTYQITQAGIIEVSTVIKPEKPSPAPTFTEGGELVAEKETPKKRLERLTTFDPKVVESDQRKLDRLRKEIENKSREEKEGKRVSLKRLKEQLEAARREASLGHLDLNDHNLELSDEEIDLLMKEQSNLAQIIESLEKAVELKQQIESLKRAERNLAALEEKTRLRELVSGLKDEQAQQTAQRDLEQLQKIELPAGTLEIAQQILEQLHRPGVFRRNINRFKRLANQIAQQLEQQQGWDPNAHAINIKAVERALLYNAIVNPSSSPPPTTPLPTPEEEATEAPAEVTPPTAEAQAVVEPLEPIEELKQTATQILGREPNNVILTIESYQRFNNTVVAIGEVPASSRVEITGQSRSYIEHVFGKIIFYDQSINYVTVESGGKAYGLDSSTNTFIVKRKAEASGWDSSTNTFIVESEGKAYGRDSSTNLLLSNMGTFTLGNPNSLLFVVGEKSNVSYENGAYESQVFTLPKMPDDKSTEGKRFELKDSDGTTRTFVVIEVINEYGEKAYAVFERKEIQTKDGETEVKYVFVDGRRETEIQDLINRLNEKTGLSFEENNITDNAFSLEPQPPTTPLPTPEEEATIAKEIPAITGATSTNYEKKQPKEAPAEVTTPPTTPPPTTKELKRKLKKAVQKARETAQNTAQRVREAIQKLTRKRRRTPPPPVKDIPNLP